MSEENNSDEIPEVLPVDRPSPKPLACWYCGSGNLSKALKLGLGAEVGEVGIKYEATGKLLGMCLLGNEPLRVTLCNECGTVVRLAVKNADHKWF